jgi:outer membrane protein assembly factor BamB
MRHPHIRLHSTLACALLLAAASSIPAAAGDVWPGLRGPSYDGAVRGARLFAGELDKLEITWKRELGAGYPVVAADDKRLVTAFQSGERDFLAAFDPGSGDELWRYDLDKAWAGHTGSHDGPIATPALADGRVFGLSPRGQLVALDAANGALLWRKHLVDDFGAEAPFYGFATSPLVAGEVVVVQIGAGEGKSIAGFDVASGELLWSAADDGIGYHSPILTELGGRTQVVAAGRTHLTGLDPSSGAVLWSHEHGGDERAMGGETIVPLPAGENRILLLHQHPESVMLQVESSDDGSWRISELWKSRAIKSTYVVPVYHDGYIYGMNSKIFTCVDAATGEMKWRAREPGDGFPTLVGDHLLIMTKPGTLRVAEASPDGYKELASLELFDEITWTAPAYSGGHIYARSMGSLARIDPIAVVDAGTDQVDQTGKAGIATSFDRFVADLGRVEDKVFLIDAYLAANWPLPVIEHTGVVHFLYRGEATDVGIVGDMIGFRREDQMTRIPGTDLFHYSTRLEPDAAVHYGFLVDFGEPIPDPLNPRRGDGLFGEVSFFEMPARQAASFAEEAEKARQGRFEEVSWESEIQEGKTRSAKVYLPAGYDRESDRLYPTLYIHGGQEVLDKGDVKNALDELIGKKVTPLIAVFLMRDPEKRGELRDPDYAQVFLDELVPRIDGRYRTIDRPMARGTAGFAGGADASLSIGFAAPDRFARLGAVWPTLFAFDGEPPPAVEHPLVVYLKWGSYHLRSPHENFDSAEAGREMWHELRDLGHRPAGGEVPEGFGWSCWRAYVGDLLTALFPFG